MRRPAQSVAICLTFRKAQLLSAVDMSRTSKLGIVSSLLEAKHDTDLAKYLTDKRTEGLSYEQIARDLHDLTDGAVSVSFVTIRRWIDDLEAVA